MGGSYLYPGGHRMSRLFGLVVLVTLVAGQAHAQRGGEPGRFV